MRTQVTVSGLCQSEREEAPPGAGEAEESRRQDCRQAAARAGSAVPGWHLRAEPRISPREGLAFHKTTHIQELPRILLALTAATSLLFCSWSSSGMGLLETKWWWENISMSQKSAPRIFYTFSSLQFQNWIAIFCCSNFIWPFEILGLNNCSSKSFASWQTNQKGAGHKKILLVLQSQYELVQINLFFPRFSSNCRLNSGSKVILHVPK